MPIPFCSSKTRETSTTTGSGAYTTSGAAPDGFVTLDNYLTPGADVLLPILVEDVDTGVWECGLYTYSAAHTLDRTQILNNSNGLSAAIVWPAGTRNVSLASLAELANIAMACANLTATTDPGVNDDITQWYTAGSIWINQTLKRVFVALTTAVGAAVWLRIPTAEGLAIVEGANKTGGLAVLVAGSVVVNTTKVTANSRIQLTSNVDGGSPGWLRVSARTPGTSFTITSSNGADTSSVAWLIVEPV